MSTDSVKQAEINQVKNLEEKTGKKINEWISIANNSGFEKHGEILNYLKTKHGIGHGYANLVVHYAKQAMQAQRQMKQTGSRNNIKGRKN